MNTTVIISPHPDDEIIGLYSVLCNKDRNIAIVYTENVSQERRSEAKKVKEYFESVKFQCFSHDIPPNLISVTNTYFFPDPIYETHPAHRHWGSIGEQLLRSRHDVTFYSTEMNCPWKREIGKWEEKEKALNEIYKSQSDLWRYERKYILFEGKIKWLMS